MEQKISGLVIIYVISFDTGDVVDSVNFTLNRPQQINGHNEE